MSLTRTDVFRIFPAAVFTVGLLGAVAYSLPRYVDHRIDLYMAEHKPSARGATGTQAQLAAVKTFLRNNHNLVAAGLPTESRKPESNLKNIVIFTDYRCTYCKAMERYIDKKLLDHGNIIYKELPILGQDSELLSEYGFAADKAGKYSAYREFMLGISSPNESDARSFFLKNGIDLPDQGDLSIYKKSIDQNRYLARGLEIQGTPAIIYNNEILYGWNENKFASLIYR